MSLRKKISGYLLLVRFHGAASTALVPIYGAVIAGSAVILHFLALFFLGVLGHIYSCSLNAYMDVEVDRFSREPRFHYKNPIVLGMLEKSETLWVCTVSLVTSIILAFLFFPVPLALLILGLSIFFTTMYNLFSKKIAGMELIYSMSLATFFLFGAVATSVDVTFTVIVIFFFVIFIQRMFELSIFGSLKDIDHDFLVGETTVSRMGVKMVGQMIKTTKKFKAYVWVLQGIYVFLVALWFIILYLLGYGIFVAGIFTAITLAILICSTKELAGTLDYRKLSSTIIGQIILTSCAIIPLMLFPFIGVWSVLLAIVPIAWFLLFSYLLALAIKPHR